MGYKLRREVRDALPPGVLTAAERLLVLELADACGDDTREGWPGAAKLAELTDLSERSIQETLSRVGRKWVELRVKLGEKDGRPIYAYAGKRTTFRFPPLPARDGATDPGSLGATDPGASEPNGAMDPEGRCDGSVQKVRQIRGPSPQGTSSKSNHSSLSPREDASDTSSPTELEPERENVDASQEQPEPRNPIARLLIKNGCPPDLTDHVRDRLAITFDIHSDGWYFTADRNGSLAPAVGAALEDLNTTPTRSCKECHDTGTAGDWMNQRDCECLWWKDPGAARKAFVAKLGDYADCEHGVAGGDMKAPNGWQHCSLCRGPGWVDKDVQTRTEKTTNNRRYEPWRPPADQSAYDRPFSGQIRSPADQRVADGQALYDHYKNLEESA